MRWGRVFVAGQSTGGYLLGIAVSIFCYWSKFARDQWGQVAAGVLIGYGWVTLCNLVFEWRRYRKSVTP